jgi:hypothetical protein
MIKHWWNNVTPKKFFLCCDMEGPVSARRHYLHRSARNEAVKLANKNNVPVFVMQAVDVILPQEDHALHPFVLHHYSDRSNTPTQFPYLKAFHPKGDNNAHEPQ